MRAVLLVVLLGVVAFLSYKYWEIDQAIKARQTKSDEIAAAEPVATVTMLPEGEPENVPAAPEPAQTAVPAVADERQFAMEHVKLKIQEKGGQIIDSHIFDSVQACNDAVSKIVAEYQRRGVLASSMADATAALGTSGNVMIIKIAGSYLYLLCSTNENINWAGYFQVKMTEENLKRYQDKP